MIAKVKNKEELRTRIGKHLGTVVLLGGDTEGDGKGGVFFWNKDSTKDDDNFAVIKVTNISVGRWIRATSGIVGLENSDLIINNITTNETFINNIAETINNNIETIINNSTTIISNVLNELNVEIQDINGKTLFFAFNPIEIPAIEEEMTPELPDTPTVNCTKPTNGTVTILGNLKPSINTTESYTLDISDGQNLIYTWTVQGGEIIGDADTDTLTVDWKDSTSLSSVNVSIGCLEGEEALFDFNFFILERPEDIIPDEIPSVSISNLIITNTCQ